jgi:hypothetical protein
MDVLARLDRGLHDLQADLFSAVVGAPCKGVRRDALTTGSTTTQARSAEFVERSDDCIDFSGFLNDCLHQSRKTEG